MTSLLTEDLGEAVLDVAEPIKVTRHLPSPVIKGRTTGAPKQTAFDIEASVQPMSQKELQRLPEGQRARGAVSVYSTEKLKTVVTSECRVPDRFEHEGINYQILSVDDWFVTAGFFKATATRIER